VLPASKPGSTATLIDPGSSLSGELFTCSHVAELFYAIVATILSWPRSFHSNTDFPRQIYLTKLLFVERN
jgi:hypothetical protein